MFEPTDYANEPEAEVKQACLEAVLDLIGEWEWKRNSIPKNDREMAELDSLAERLRNDLADKRFEDVLATEEYLFEGPK